MELVIPAAGAAIGFAVTGTPQGAQVGWMVGSTISAVMNQPDGIPGPRVDDLGFSGSSFGIPVARGWGTFPVAGSYIWAPDITEVETSSGGKGGPSVIGYDYYGSFAVILCEGPVTGIRRLWFDTDLVYDASEDNTGVYKMEGLHLTIHLGTTTQIADPVIEEVEGSGNVPGYRGYCYITVDTLALLEYGNKVPTSVRAEVVKNSADQDSNVVIDADNTSGRPRYSEADDVIVYSTTTHIYRYDPVSGSQLSVVPYDTLKSAYIIHPTSGLIYTWRWNETAPLNYYHPMLVDPKTGATTYANQCLSISSDGPVCSDCTGNNFSGINDIYLVNGQVIMTPAPAGSYVYYWPDPPTGCFPVAIPASAPVSYIMVDSDGNEWWTFSSLNTVEINGTSFNLSTLHGIAAPTLMQWHVPTQSMLIDGTGGVYRVSYDGSLTYLEAGPSLGRILSSNDRRWITDPSFWTKGDVTTFYHINISDMSTIRTKTPITGWGSSIWASEPIFDSVTNSIFGAGGGLSTEFNKLLLDRLPPGTQSLATVVGEIGSDLDARIDVSDLDQTVNGFLMTRPEQNREAIRRLMVSHAFDGTEADGEEKFIELDGAVSLTIPETDLAAHQYGAATPPQTEISRVQEIAFPKRAEVLALSKALEYESTSQGAGRQLSKSTGSLKISLMEVLTDDQTAQLAEVLLHVPRIERNVHRWPLSFKYLYLHPIDQVNLVKGSITHRVRMTESDWSGGLTANSGVSTDAAVYTSTATGAGSDGFIPTVVRNLLITEPYLLDAPLLSSFEDSNTPGFYAGYTSDMTSWPGATLFRVPDITSADAVNLSTGSNEATAGFTTSILADTTNTTTWDDVSTVTVRMDNGTLSSSTDAAVLEGANAIFMIESGELIQFVNVSVTNSPDDGERTLSRLLRGRRGTEWATSEHVTVERFALLTVPAIYNVPTSITTSGVEHYYRAVTFGLTLFDSKPQAFTNNNVRLKPFSPVDPGVSESSGDITITWVRRTRVFLPPDYSSIPIGEDTESYEIDILDIDGTVLRTLTATSESVTYTNAQLISDFGASGVSGFSFIIYQISATVGRGYPLESSTSDLDLFLPVYTDFTEDVAGTEPITDWTEYGSTGQSTFTATIDAGAVGGQTGIHHIGLNTNAGFTWDKAGTAYDVEILAKTRGLVSASADLWNSIALRIDGDAKNYYTICVDTSGDGRLYKVLSNTYTQLGSTYVMGLSFGVDTWYRFRANSTNLQVKWWQGGIGSEPGAWQIDLQDVAIASGAVGFWNRKSTTSGRDVDYDQFSVAYNGATAAFP